MKSNYWLLTVIFALVALPGKAGEWIRINQLGYLPQSVKVAVFMSEEGTNVENYSLIDAFTGKVVRTFNTTKATGKMGGMKSTYRLNFSDFTEPGTYYLKAGKAVSPRFPINAQVYNGTADYLLHYMRQQRCGYNPFLKDSCHVHDGYIVYCPNSCNSGIHIRRPRVIYITAEQNFSACGILYKAEQCEILCFLPEHFAQCHRQN